MAVYRPDGKEYVSAALALMIENLTYNLKIADDVSLRMDAGENDDFLTDDEIPQTEEGLRESKNETWQDGVREIEHIQRRILQVTELKEIFEKSEEQTHETLSRIYTALRASLLYEAMNFGFGNPTEEIIASGIQGLGKEKAEEVTRLGKTIKTYTEALFMGFRVNPLWWTEFPFDEYRS